MSDDPNEDPKKRLEVINGSMDNRPGLSPFVNILLPGSQKTQRNKRNRALRKMA
jgi:hypothetical protein